MLAFESRRARRALGGAALGVGSFFWSALGWAQDPAAAEPPPAEPAPVEPGAPPPSAEPTGHINLTGSSPTIDLSTPPPPEPVGRTYHQHEGFYLRLGGGFGYLAANMETDRAGTVDLESNGISLDFEGLVGGSPGPGFAIGGGVIGSLQLSGDWESDDAPGSASADLTTLLVGAFADGFPDPKKGWHVGGMLGLASASFDTPGGNDGSDGLGVGGAAWVGYDAWVAPEWSIGGALRLDAMRVTDSDADLTISSVGARFAVSVLYH
jgi:hypothetical protein